MSIRSGVLLPPTVLLGLLAATFAGPRQGRAASDTNRSVVFVAQGIEDADVLEVEAAVRGQLSDLSAQFLVDRAQHLHGVSAQADLVARHLAEERRAGLVFWLDPTHADRVHLVLTGDGQPRILTRRLDRSARGGRYEALSVIVRATAGAWFRELEQGRPPADSGSTTPAVPPKEDATASRQTQETVEDTISAGADEEPGRLTLGLAYVLEAHSTAHPATHALGLDVDVRFYDRWSAFLGYRVLGAIEGTGRLASTRIQRHPVRIGVRAVWPLGWRVELGGSLGLDLDYATESTRLLANSSALTATEQDGLVVSVTPTLDTRVRVTRWLRFTVSVGVEVFVNHRRYVTSGPEGKEVLVNPWIAQPIVQAGLLVLVY